MCPSTVDREQLPGQQTDEEDSERYHEGRLRTSLNKGDSILVLYSEKEVRHVEVSFV